MIIHEKYGPQFDPADGTVGNTKLVKRYAILNENGLMWPCAQGRHTKATREEAEAELKLFREANPEMREWNRVHVGALWCWPCHLDPVGGCKEEAGK